MKILIVFITLSLANVYAEESKPVQATEDSKNVQSVLKEAKKDRKKKVEMCHECGKPEVNCDCEGEEHKKSE
jgi:hypothetical protein